MYMVTGARQVVPACYLYPAEFPYAVLTSWVISGRDQGLRQRLCRCVLCSVAVMSSHPCTLYLYPPQQYGAVREVLRRPGVSGNVATPPLLALFGPIRRSTRRHGSKGRSGRRVITGGLLRRATVTLPL